MLYKIAHYLRDNLGFIWDWIEASNSFVFGIRYSKGLKSIPKVLQQHSGQLKVGIEIKLRLASVEDAEALACFFLSQPTEEYNYFQPHPFDKKSLDKLIRRTSFIMMLAVVDNQIVGYFFLRSFVHGRCFLGKMVDRHWRGKGIGKEMCKAAMDVATSLKLRMFESINKENKASLRSSSVLKQVVVQELENGDLLIEDLPL